MRIYREDNKIVIDGEHTTSIMSKDPFEALIESTLTEEIQVNNFLINCKTPKQRCENVVSRTDKRLLDDIDIYKRLKTESHRENVVSRTDKRLLYDIDIYKMLKTESHHEHEIVFTDNNVFEWKQNFAVTSIVDTLDLNKIIQLFKASGYTKNSEVYRKLFRDMGYPLLAYYNLFYISCNNPDKSKYNPTK